MEVIIDNDVLLQHICSFIKEVGIPITKGEINEQTFLPGIEIINGGLVYDPEKLLYPGDLLHEAGHIALVPAEFRHKTSGNMKDLDFSSDGEEIGVMLWSYAACLQIGLPPQVVFHPEGYKGDSEWILKNYAEGVYIGLPLLQWMGLCAPQGKAPGFPVMQKWLRD
jgi:hypothetical protein